MSNAEDEFGTGKAWGVSPEGELTRGDEVVPTDIAARTLNQLERLQHITQQAYEVASSTLDYVQLRTGLGKATAIQNSDDSVRIRDDIRVFGQMKQLLEDPIFIQLANSWNSLDTQSKQNIKNLLAASKS